MFSFLIWINIYIYVLNYSFQQLTNLLYLPVVCNTDMGVVAQLGMSEVRDEVAESSYVLLNCFMIKLLLKTWWC